MKRLFSRLLVALIAIISLVPMACASVPIETIGSAFALHDTAEQACAFYRKAKPSVVAYREWAKAHWNDTLTQPDGQTVALLNDDQKTLLLELDAYLPKLDKAGTQICHYVDSIEEPVRARPPRRTAASNVDWDRVLSVTLKVATTAVQLKAEGAF